MSDRNEILTKNIQCIEKDGLLLNEERQLLIRSFVDDIVRPSLSFEENAEEILKAYQFLTKDSLRNSWFDLPETKAEIAKCFSLATSFESLSKDVHLIEKDENVACWSTNRYSQLAYEKMSQQCPYLKQTVVESFTDVCEAINNNECCFGLLPIENSADGRLASFYRAIDRYDLKICATYDVENENGDAFSKLALVSKSLHRFENVSPDRIEVSSISSNSQKVSELIFSAKTLGVPVLRLFSSPLYYRKDACMDNLTLELSPQNSTSFLTYLAIFEKEINIIGIFKQF